MTGESSPEIAFVLGTRPEIIKLAPVVRECERRSIPFTIVHTGQHYSDELDEVFFEDLKLPEPDHHLGVGSGSHGEQTGAMVAEIEEVLLAEQPDVVLAQGDTNSVLAAAIAASKLDVELGHVEAGLRSFDREMPEETNRVLTDHAADYLFAPTEEAAAHLEDEGLPAARIFTTGNTIVDAVQQHRQLSEDGSAIMDELGLVSGEFLLLTAHRAENVDDGERFARILDGVERLASTADVDVVYPIHPRAEGNVESFALQVPDAIETITPLDFLDFLKLESAAALVVTDSGGVQEETCILQTPCVTVRDSTERPETLDVGSNRLVGTDPGAIVDGGERMLEREPDWENPFGSGDAAEQIVRILRNGGRPDTEPAQRSPKLQSR